MGKELQSKLSEDFTSTVCIRLPQSGAIHLGCYLQEPGNLSKAADDVFLTSNCQTGLGIMKLDKTNIVKEFITMDLQQELNFNAKVINIVL